MPEVSETPEAPRPQTRPINWLATKQSAITALIIFDEHQIIVTNGSLVSARSDENGRGSFHGVVFDMTGHSQESHAVHVWWQDGKCETYSPERFSKYLVIIGHLES